MPNLSMRREGKRHRLEQVSPLQQLPTPRLWFSLYLALCFANRLPDVLFS